MKRPDSFLTNTTTPAGRALGAAKNNPGDDSGSGMDKEVYNDPAYAILATVDSYKDGGNTDTDETTIASDLRDAIEQLTHKRVTDNATPINSLAEWSNVTTYTTLGELVTHEGFQFVAHNVTGNLAKNPLTNPDFWFPIPKPNDLLERFASGQIYSGGLSPMADRAGGNYQQNIAFGRYRLGGNGGTFYNFFRVALDGTQVTGDGTLEAIFDPGGSDEYFNIDLIAPDVVGTRTLIDMGEKIVTPQSSGGENDTLGEEQDDRLQGHNVSSPTRLANGQGNSVGANFPRTNGAIVATDALTGTIITDGVNGTPRTGLTTRPKEFTEGASYIIVMLPV